MVSDMKLLWLTGSTDTFPACSLIETMIFLVLIHDCWFINLGFMPGLEETG